MFELGILFFEKNFMDFDNAGTVDLVLAAVDEISTVLLNKVR